MTVARGRAYFDAGKATVSDVSSGIIAGIVRGGRAKPYRVFVSFAGKGANRVVRGSCSCPVGSNCKHAVALLFQAQKEGKVEGLPGAVEVLPDARPDARPEVEPQVARWLDDLAQVAVRNDETYPDDVRQRLMYVLSVRTSPKGIRQAVVELRSVRLLKDGTFSSAINATYDPANVLQASVAKFLRSSDITILRRIHARSAFAIGGGHVIGGPDGAETLDLMLATGRCRWESLDGPALHLGENRVGRVQWRLLADGRQTPTVRLEDAESLDTLPLTPPYFVAWADGQGQDVLECGRIGCAGVPDLLVGKLLEAPPVDREALEVVRTGVARVMTGLAAAAGSEPPPLEDLLPRVLAPPVQVRAPLQPRLLLHARTLRRVSPSWYRPVDHGWDQNIMMALLSFGYGPLDVPANDPRPRPVIAKDGDMLEVVRDRRAEKEAVELLASYGFLPADRLRNLGLEVPADCLADMIIMGLAEDIEDLWLDFLIDLVPGLREAGWDIVVAPDFPLQLVHADSPVQAEVSGGSGMDWFDLNLGVLIDGAPVDILPALLRVLRGVAAGGADLEDFFSDDGEDDNDVRMTLPDGRLLMLPYGRVRPILLSLARIFSVPPADGPLRLTQADAAGLADLEDSVPGLSWRGDDRLRRLGRALRDSGGMPQVAVPEAFTGTLRPYQQAGLNWMQFLRGLDLGGILADDMGLGKTVQTLAHLSVEKAEGRLDRPCLLVVPTSLVPNWRNEAATFAPHLSVLVLHGQDRKGHFDALAAHDIVITTYALLPLDADVLCAQPWHMVILDEAQAVKNAATSAAKTLRRLETRHRLGLTGTPLENNLGELWALFDAVSPGLLGDRKSFTRLWRTPIEKKGNVTAQERLARRVAPFLLRRTKAIVAADLPAKTEIVEHVALTAKQRALYESVRLAMHHKVRQAVASKGLARSHIELLDALLKLRQTCCDPRLVKVGTQVKDFDGAHSAKLQHLMTMVPEMVAEGRRILLFSQFTSMLDLIAPEMSARDIPFVTLTGQTRDRAEPVRRFQGGEVPLFLISLKAGGTGLNLTAADTVIHYDPWWNPAVEAQATDRAHRIGQDKPVFVHKLIAEHTVEEKMQDLKNRKQALADGLFDPSGKTALDITDADIDFLLGPV